MGPLRIGKCDSYKTFPAEKVSFHKSELFGWKGLVDGTFNSSFLNLKDPIPKTFKLLKVLFRAAGAFIFPILGEEALVSNIMTPMSMYMK